MIEKLVKHKKELLSLSKKFQELDNNIRKKRIKKYAFWISTFSFSCFSMLSFTKHILVPILKNNVPEGLAIGLTFAIFILGAMGIGFLCWWLLNFPIENKNKKKSILFRKILARSKFEPDEHSYQETSENIEKFISNLTEEELSTLKSFSWKYMNINKIKLEKLGEIIFEENNKKIVSENVEFFEGILKNKKQFYSFKLNNTTKEEKERASDKMNYINDCLLRIKDINTTKEKDVIISKDKNIAINQI